MDAKDKLHYNSTKVSENVFTFLPIRIYSGTCIIRSPLGTKLVSVLSRWLHDRLNFIQFQPVLYLGKVTTLDRCTAKMACIYGPMRSLWYTQDTDLYGLTVWSLCPN